MTSRRGCSGLPPGSTGAEEEAATGWRAWAPTAAAFTAGGFAGGLIGLIIIRPVNAVLGWLFRGFNRMFDRMTEVYGRIVGGFLRISVIVLMLYGGLLGLTYWEFIRTPTGFVPQQDKGYLLSTSSCPTPPRWSARSGGWLRSRPWPARRRASRTRSASRASRCS